MATFARTRRRTQRAIVLPRARHGLVWVGKLCICVCDTIRSVRSLCGHDTATFRRLSGRWRGLDRRQAIGFGVLGYPVELNTFLWGFAIGAAALIATAVSTLVRRPPSIGHLIELAIALLAAYVAYEVVLFAFTPVLGGAGAFTVAIIARIGLLNVLWMIGLAAAYELLKAFVLKHQQFVT